MEWWQVAIPTATLTVTAVGLFIQFRLKRFETRLTEAVWLKQQLRTEKKELYGALLKLIGELHSTLIDRFTLLEDRECELVIDINKNNDLVISQLGEFVRLTALAKSFLAQECGKLLDDFRFQTLEKGVKLFDTVKVETYSDGLFDLREGLIMIAKKDLGISTEEPKPEK